MDQHVKGAGGGALTGDEWLALNEQDRAIAVEYALRPMPRDLAASAAGKIIAGRFEMHRPYSASLAADLTVLNDFFAAIPLSGDDAGTAPFWDNGWFPPLDAITLCGFMRQAQPRRYIEVGSGNSTKFARALIEFMRLETEIISIDPSPRADIDRLCDRVVRSRMEDVDSAFFRGLDDHDMLFVDSSHRSFQNSDVTVFFMDVLPSLPDGMIYGIHDIFLPYDYPESFVNRFYNEQYLLATYLISDDHDEVLFPVHYVARHHVEAEPVRRLGEQIGIGDAILNGGALWMRKGRRRDGRRGGDTDDRASVGGVPSAGSASSIGDAASKRRAPAGAVRCA